VRTWPLLVRLASESPLSTLCPPVSGGVRFEESVALKRNTPRPPEPGSSGGGLWPKGRVGSLRETEVPRGRMRAGTPEAPPFG